MNATEEHVRSVTELAGIHLTSGTQLISIYTAGTSWRDTPGLENRRFNRGTADRRRARQERNMQERVRGGEKEWRKENVNYWLKI